MVLDVEVDVYRLSLTMDLSDFGTPLDLAPPPPRLVTEAADVQRQTLVDAAGVQPAPTAGERPQRLPESVPLNMPLPAGANVVHARDQSVVLESLPPEGVDPSIWFERVRLLFDIELGNESYEGGGPTSASESGGTDEAVTERTFERPFVFAGRNGVLALEWKSSGAATRIEIRFVD